MTGDDRGSAPASAWERLGTVIILAAAAWFYVWTATTAANPLSLKLQPDDLYNRLADGFLSGHLGFAEPAPAGLAQLANPYDPSQNAPFARYHDVSYYHGRYYIYFGPAPLLLLVPWRAITRTYLSENLAAAAFAWAAALVGCLLLRRLRRSHFPSTRPWVMLACALGMAFGNLLPLLLRRPVTYEVAIACACFFGLLALLFFHRALTAPGGRTAGLAWTSLCLGLAIASRPDYLFGAAAFGLVYFRLTRPSTPAGRDDWIRELVAAIAPLAGVGIVLALYNHARFGSWTEFGTHYMLAGGNQQHLQMNSVRFVPINLYYYLLARPQFSAFFPFFRVIAFTPFHPPNGYLGEEDAYGILPAMPVLLAVCWLWPLLPARRKGTARLFLLPALACCAALGAFFLTLCGAANRYMVDFVTPFVPLALAGILAWEARPASWQRLAGRALWTAALAYTILFNAFASIEHNDLFRYYRPDEYRRIAHAFDRIPDHLGATSPSRVGPLRIHLTLPGGTAGQLQPLVVTGVSFQADFLWIFYSDPHHVVIGFEHTSYGGPKSAPIEVDYAAAHTLVVELGSLYPPPEDGYYDRMPAAEADRLQHTLRVELDGRVVLAGRQDFYEASAGEVAIGRNPVSDAFGRRFTGRILGVERLPPSAAH